MAKISPLMLAPPLIFLALAGLFLVSMYREDPDALLGNPFRGRESSVRLVGPGTTDVDEEGSPLHTWAGKEPIIGSDNSPRGNFAYAVFDEGTDTREVLLTGVPQEVINDLSGRIWKKIIDKSELSAYQDKYDVISTRLVPA